MTYAWVMRGAGALCIASAFVLGFVNPALARMWSSIMFYAFLLGGVALIALTNEAALAERERRRADRAEILRELEIRDGVREPD